MNGAMQHQERLRAATEEALERLAALLAAPRPGRRGGAGWPGPLGGALGLMLASVGPIAAQSRHPAVVSVWPAYDALATSAREGRGWREPAPGALSDELLLRARVVAWLARHHARHRPAALVGALYALAGALRALQEPGAEARDALAWQAFEASVGAAPLAGDEPAQAAAAAREVAEELAGLAASLDGRAARPLSQLVAVLNPEAGKHPIAGELAELEAAALAGDRSWAEFPYLRLRYAERGIRYAWSDSAWLVTLCHLPQAEIERQIDWLGRLLAARGMPRLLLERHLELLHEELTRAIPGREAHYAPLRWAAAGLRAERLAHVDEGLSGELEAALVAQLGPRAAREVPGAASLLASAVADERAGVAGGAASLLDWLTDPERFGQSWIAAVRRIAQMARARAQGAPPR